MQAGGSQSVHLNPVMNGSQFVKWQMSLNSGPLEGPNHYPQIDVPQAATNGTITFQIVGNPNNGVVFAPTVPPPPPPGSGPIYIHAGTTKPTSGIASDFSVSVSPDGKTLTLTDSNQHAGNYTYVMNFQTPIPSLDPIINNGGPGGPKHDYLWYAIGAIAVLVIVVLVMRMMKGPATPPPKA